MTEIRVNTDTMRQLGECFEQVAAHLRDETLPRVNSLIGELEHHWHGHSRARFEDLFGNWRRGTQEIIELSYQLGEHLEQSAQAFENADNS